MTRKMIRAIKLSRPYWAVINIRNKANQIRISRWAKKNNVHLGTRQILLGGIWEDREHNVYNCLGRKIGKLILVEEEES